MAAAAPLPEQLDPGLPAAGFNLAGVLKAADFDRAVPPAWRSEVLLPRARSAVVLGCGGRGFGEAFEASAEARQPVDPVDRFTGRVVREAAERMAARHPTVAHFYWESRGGSFADFVGLARACGLGTPGRLGLLLHPRFGPWLAVRAVLLTAAPLAPTPPLAEFDPCRGCSAPCTSACPVVAPTASGFRVDACAESRLVADTCPDHCAARGACVVGPRWPPCGAAPADWSWNPRGAADVREAQRGAQLRGESCRQTATDLQL